MTTLYQKVGDNMTQEIASENLVSTLQGFKLKAKDAGSIVDKFNEVAKHVLAKLVVIRGVKTLWITILVKGWGHRRPRKDFIFA